MDLQHLNFPVRDHYYFFNHCGISPLYDACKERMMELMEAQTKSGSIMFMDHYMQELDRFKKNLSQIINTTPDRVAAIRNTTEGISFIANGFNFEPGDEIILFDHEYPANYYPWVRLEEKGVVVRRLGNLNDFEGVPDLMPGRWSFEELENLTSGKTRFISLSHVQFVSGYAADLERLGEFCRKKGIYLIVDVAQSFGALPIDVKKYNISALAGSGWKWTMGPVGVSVFYISEELDRQINSTVVGAETMVQGPDFLNHEWNPHSSAKRFEYSTSSVYLIAGINKCFEDIQLGLGIDNIYKQILMIQDLFLEKLDNFRFVPILHESINRSGILPLYHPEPETVVKYLEAKNIICTTRGGYVRIAPHFYTRNEDIDVLTEALNSYNHE
ncbi:aminotransferase class V-fold PLP-dependent enzyme [Membranihabitans maritimus]|uniref:aminotransferase class V-fold PLP-dependent enzyme n=1 Tax=Membranihabitans maritimus TaxID=2904244 RepID=UPI001F1EE079|nr:aminotransferase class V-fold PLP-dependent enzyme [Membranihabitans maritimus]